MQTEYIHTG